VVTSDLPLGDVRVIDMTVARAGPTCVRQLADWGADVIRVEPPAGAASPGTGENRHGCDFQHLHRNKRSLSLNLKQPEAREVLMRLVDTADVLVENMRPDVKKRLGFDFETVHARNPRLVYGSISGFGQNGPYGSRGGVDQIAQGMGGLMSVTGLPGSEPTRVGIPVADLASGLYLAIGVLVALHDRARSGRGRWVQTSLLEAMIAMMDFQAARWTIDHEVPAQAGNHHPMGVPTGCFASADGYINIAGPSGRLLRNLSEVIGLPGLPDDPRFDSAAKRSANREELNALIAGRLRTRTTAEWVQALNQAGVPCAIWR
jgi:formyl-CoA transferase